MLWSSTVSDTIAKIFKGAIYKDTQARKDDIEKRLAYYHDDQGAYTLALMSKYFKDVSKFDPAFVNVTKKVVNRLAQTYTRPPKREIEGTEQDQAIFSEIAKTSKLSAKMKIASRYAKLLKTIILRPVFRNGKMDLDILTGDILDVTWGDTPEDLRSVQITHYPVNGKAEEITYSLWTPETVSTLDYRGQSIETVDNPYHVLPFIPIWDRCPTANEFWLPGGDDLISAQEAINTRLTDLQYVLRMQGFGVGYTKGRENSGPLEIGPGTMVELPLEREAEIGYVNTKAPIKDTLEAIRFIIEQTFIANGLSSSSFQEKAVRESGVSKIVSNQELDELRQDDIELFRGYEQQLFEMERLVWNVHNTGRKIGPQARLKIDFYDPKPAIDPKQQAEAWEKQMSLGVISSVDIAMEKNPDLKTREDAMAYLLKIQMENEQIKGRNF